MRRLPLSLCGLRTAVTLALVAIAGFSSIVTVDARQLYVSADAAISLDPDDNNTFVSVDTSTQCRATGYYTADTTGTGTITLTKGRTSSRSVACTGTNAAVSFPASCVMTPTTLTCGTKTFTSSVDSSWQLSSTAVYKDCSSSTNAQIRVNNTHMTLDAFANGCVITQSPYVARGGLVYMMGAAARDAACSAKQPTNPPSTPRPPGPPSTPSPPTRSDASFSATATTFCQLTGRNVCFYTDCSAEGGATPLLATAKPPATAKQPAASTTPPGATATPPAATETPSSPSSSSTSTGVVAGVVVVAVVGIAVGVALKRRRGSSAARVTTSDTTSGVLVPQPSPYTKQQAQQQQPHPAAQKVDDDFL